MRYTHYNVYVREVCAYGLVAVDAMFLFQAGAKVLYNPRRRKNTSRRSFPHAPLPLAAQQSMREALFRLYYSDRW